METIKKRLFSGVQPSGIVTLGNYLGAIKNWVDLQDSYDCIFSVVDMHAITVPKEPAELRRNTLELLALYLACGLDEKKSTLFVQSHVPCHAELAWVLDTVTYIGELSRMTQFKDKSARLDGSNINMGLMNYPVLMAADILLYQSELVPVGADQKQHLELSRDIAIRFNSRYSDTFKVPEGFIPKEGAKIMSLADPMKKMSKSDANANGFICMDDDKDTIIKKFKRAVTDSDNEVRYSEDKRGISNLLTIYSVLCGITIEAAEIEFKGFGYGEFKEAVGVLTAERITPIREGKNEILKDKQALDKILIEGKDKAFEIARKTLRKVYKKIGFYQL